ncbi:MAG: hypothetical protein ACI4U3_10610 [Traorella sp.]
MNKNDEDILYYSYQKSKKHPCMSLSDRAAQFAPFQALSGYKEAILESQRLIDHKIELSEDEKSEINEKLQFMIELPKQNHKVKIEYFQPDTLKEGGRYITCFSNIIKINENEKYLLLEDKTKISFYDIYQIEFL